MPSQTQTARQVSPIDPACDDRSTLLFDSEQTPRAEGDSPDLVGQVGRARSSGVTDLEREAIPSALHRAHASPPKFKQNCGEALMAEERTPDADRDGLSRGADPQSSQPTPAGELSPSKLRELVERAQRGDRDAFAVLIERHQRVAAAKAYGMLGDSHLAADSLQEAFFKTWQKISTLRQPERFSGWFLAIVQRTSLDVARRRHRVSGHEHGWEELSGAESASASDAPGIDPIVAREQGLRIREAIRALPPEYREVILLKHAEGRSYREIARLLRTTVKAVESRLFRARQQLGRSLASKSDEGRERDN